MKVLNGKTRKQKIFYMVCSLLISVVLFQYFGSYTLDKVRTEYTDTVVVEALGDRNEAAVAMGVSILQINAGSNVLDLDDKNLSDWVYMPERDAMIWSGKETKTFEFETPIISSSDIVFATDI